MCQMSGRSWKKYMNKENEKLFQYTTIEVFHLHTPEFINEWMKNVDLKIIRRQCRRRHSTDFSVCNLNQNGVKRNEIDIDLLRAENYFYYLKKSLIEKKVSVTASCSLEASLSAIIKSFQIAATVTIFPPHIRHEYRFWQCVDFSIDLFYHFSCTLWN